MVKIPIRNGGFEDGTTRHWIETEGCTFTADDADPHVGTYAGKGVSVANGDPTFVQADYIPVVHGEVYEINLWHKWSLTDDIEITILEYDEELNLLGYLKIYDKDGSLAWAAISSMYTVREGITYIRIQVKRALAETGDWGLIDDLTVRRVDNTERGLLRKEISGNSDRTDSYNTSGSYVDCLGYSKYVADLRYDYVSGTITSIDVYIMEAIWGTGRVVEVGHFTQVVTTDVVERISLPIATGRLLYVNVVVVKADASVFRTAVDIIGIQT